MTPLGNCYQKILLQSKPETAENYGAIFDIMRHAKVGQKIAVA